MSLAQDCFYGATDKRFEVGHPKGVTLNFAETAFDRYKKEHNDQSLKLCRFCVLHWSNWINYWSWPDLLTHPRWDVPACSHSFDPSKFGPGPVK